jgi:hypothetical protein
MIANGSIIVQAGNRWLLAANDRARSYCWVCICGRSGTETGFRVVHRFPMSIFIAPTTSHIHKHHTIEDKAIPVTDFGGL